MNNKNTIRSLISILLLCTFALSITPKKLLHSWLANHSDQAPKTKGSHSTTVDVAGFHCNVDNLVAESPFNGSFNHFELSYPPIFSVNTGERSYAFFSLHHFYSELRGPPSLS